MRKQSLCLTCLLGWIGTLAFPIAAQTVQAPYDASYTLVDLGAVPGLPGPNGGLTFLAGDPNTLLIGGEANFASGMLYAVGVVRDVDGHISGFAGSAAAFAEAPYNDGGVTYGPGDVLFLSRFPVNELGQVLPGSLAVSKVVDLAAVGVAASPGGLSFVPAGFPGAGSLKLASWEDGGFYTLSLTPDGAGTFDVTAATLETSIPGGPEGFVYVPAGSPLFSDNSQMLVSDWSEDSISVYAIDAGGNPVPATRQPFVLDVTGPEGAVIDPLTGDFLFSTFRGAGDTVMLVRGFAPPADDGPVDPRECVDPQPLGQGYWHRQCLGVPVDDGGLDPGTYGRGPREPIEPGFVEVLMPCADAALRNLGFVEETTCSGMHPEPSKSPCERAMRRLTALALNVCSNRLQTSCEVELTFEGCEATTVGGLMNELAGLIQSGFCLQAAHCGGALGDGIGLIGADRTAPDGGAGRGNASSKR